MNFSSLLRREETLIFLLPRTLWIMMVGLRCAAHSSVIRLEDTPTDRQVFTNQ